MGRLLFVAFILILVGVKLCNSGDDAGNPDAVIYCTPSDVKRQDAVSSDSARYIFRRMATCYVPYRETDAGGNANSKIAVNTDPASECDLVALVKQDGRIVRNVYVAAGDTAALYVPNGTYRVYIYSGTGWNPEKDMPGGLKGGFVADEAFSADAPVTLAYSTYDYNVTTLRGACPGRSACSRQDAFGLR